VLRTRLVRCRITGAGIGPLRAAQFPLWWAGTGSVETDSDVGDYTMYPEGYPDFPMPQALETSQEDRAVKISCLVSDLCFEWRLQPSLNGTEISVHVEVPDHEAHRLDTQRDIIRRSVQPFR
jgi:hypothetical protein